MKYLLLIIAAAVAWAYWRRSRRAKSPTRSPRSSRLFGTDEAAINVRSADNVRLLSDKQLNAIERVDGERE